MQEEPLGGNTGGRSGAIEGKPEGCEVPSVHSVECGCGSDRHSREVPKAHCMRQLDGY